MCLFELWFSQSICPAVGLLGILMECILILYKYMASRKMVQGRKRDADREWTCGHSRGRSEWKSLSRVRLYGTPWTVAYQAPLSMGFSRQGYCGSHSLLQGIFQTQGLNPGLLHCRRFFTSWSSREAQEYWSGKPIPSPWDLPNRGIKPGLPALQVDSLPAEQLGKSIG